MILTPIYNLIIIACINRSHLSTCLKIILFIINVHKQRVRIPSQASAHPLRGRLLPDDLRVERPPILKGRLPILPSAVALDGGGAPEVGGYVAVHGLVKPNG